jgi:hypothetical protein
MILKSIKIYGVYYLVKSNYEVYYFYQDNAMKRTEINILIGLESADETVLIKG